MLSQGATDPVYFVKDNSWFIFASMQNLAHRLTDITSNMVSLKTSRPEKVEIALLICELWGFLYDKMLFLFP